ncbi:TIGR02391 family protein [Streptomyces sp. NPDC005576]|uniref:TIGR02391 family protein n=1 Tax=Streptomyces sp. NPDC005576 TaxID=3364726 RepID=UPI003699C5B0
MQRGAAAFSEGSYAALRNPNRHEDGVSELSEHQALEQLAALSVLARWVEEAALLFGQD